MVFRPGDFKSPAYASSATGPRLVIVSANAGAITMRWAGWRSTRLHIGALGLLGPAKQAPNEAEHEDHETS